VQTQGAVTESFYPGPIALASLSAPDRARLARALGLTSAMMSNPALVAAAYGPRCLPLSKWREVKAAFGLFDAVRL
jgi:hypothetical protein